MRWLPRICARVGAQVDAPPPRVVGPPARCRGSSGPRRRGCGRMHSCSVLQKVARVSSSAPACFMTRSDEVVLEQEDGEVSHQCAHRRQVRDDVAPELNVQRIDTRGSLTLDGGARVELGQEGLGEHGSSAGRVARVSLPDTYSPGGGGGVTSHAIGGSRPRKSLRRCCWRDRPEPAPGASQRDRRRSSTPRPHASSLNATCYVGPKSRR